MHDFANLYVRRNQYTAPLAPGYCILIHGRLFHRIGGFDENVRHAEHFDLVRRAAKLRPFRVLEDVHINVSVRRYRKEGRLAYVGHSLAVSWHRTSGRPQRAGSGARRYRRAGALFESRVVAPDPGRQ